MTLTSPAVERPRQKKTRRDPNPHFKPDKSRQLDALYGCADLQVPQDHLARDVLRVVGLLDTKSIEEKYSSLGRHGYHPRQALAVWVYGSLIGLHESTKLARALQTDAALRLLSGGHAISAGTLRRFRNLNRAFFEEAIAQTVELASDSDLLRPQELGVDSMRLRAHAATSSSRTLRRSRERLAELQAVAVDALPEAERETHAEKVTKHEEAIARCEAEGRTNFVTTNSSAGLLKFPDGSAAPGHRITVVAAGKRERLVLAVLVDADPNDYGKAGPVLQKAKGLFERLGILGDQQLQAALDAGYWCEIDLLYAAQNRGWIDMIIAERGDDDPSLFGRDKFTVLNDGKMLCPAGRAMRGPFSDGRGRGRRYYGVGCEECSLKPQCTRGKTRSLVVLPSFDEVRNDMRQRLRLPDAKQRYNDRIATVEPVFSNLESAMKYRRATTRHERGVIAEILLKVLSHNVSRLIAARKVRPVFLVVYAF